MARRRQSLTASRTKLARRFATELKSEMGSHIRHVILYGSVARGDDRRGSDIDLLVEVRRRTPAVERRIFEAVAERATEDGELIVPLVLSTAERRRHMPHYLERRIRSEGKTLA